MMDKRMFLPQAGEQVREFFTFHDNSPVLDIVVLKWNLENIFEADNKSYRYRMQRK